MASASHRGSSRRSAGVVVNVRDFGAVGDGITDDREAIQDAIDFVSTAGRGEVFVPDGTYSLTKNPVSSYCLMLKSGVRIVGQSQAGAILKEAAAIATSVRLFYATNADSVTISTITLDGNKATQTVNEHRHGLFAWGSTNMLVEHVTSQNFTGDGFYVFTGSDGVTFRNCTGVDNSRNGITLGGACTNVDILSSTFARNTAQQVDSEPSGVVSNVRVKGCTITSGDGLAVTVGGIDSTTLGNNWTITGNTIVGSVWIVWAENVLVRGNSITVVQAEHPAVDVYRLTRNIVVERNTIALTRNNGTDTMYACRIVATGSNNQPDGVVFRHNTITVENPGVLFNAGFTVHGATNLTIEHNTITGPGSSGAYDGGILLRATVTGTGIVIRHNTITNYGATGIKVYGETPIGTVDVSYNTIADNQAVPTTTVGIVLDNGEDTALAITCIENVIDDSIATDITWPTDVATLVGTTHQGHPVYMVPRTPEGMVSAAPGALAIIQVSGVYGDTYKKSSGAGLTGWTVI